LAPCTVQSRNRIYTRFQRVMLRPPPPFLYRV